MGSEGWAACSSGYIWSVSSRPVLPLLSIIELSSQPVALKYLLQIARAIGHYPSFLYIYMDLGRTRFTIDGQRQRACIPNSRLSNSGSEINARCRE